MSISIILVQLQVVVVAADDSVQADENVMQILGGDGEAAGCALQPHG